MMKIKLVLTAIISVIICSVSCSENPTAPSRTDSELTLLMRQMYLDLEAAKSELNQVKAPTIQLNHSGIFSAKSTDSEKAESAIYQAFAKDYMNKLEAFNAAKPGEKASFYNDVVSSCESCHSSLCPGPLVRIKKLKFF